MSEFNKNIPGTEFSNIPAQRENIEKPSPESIALEKLKSSGEILSYYKQSRSTYIDMNGWQTDLSDEEVINHFKESPTLFHSTFLTKENKIERIGQQGLTTESFRERAGIKPEPPLAEVVQEANEYTEDDFWNDMMEMEYDMDSAFKKSPEYNKKYISFSYLPWWNEREIIEDAPNSEFDFDDNGKIKDLKISIALNPKSGRRIIEENLESLKDNDSEIAKLGRLTSFCEVLEPIRTAPRDFAAIFLLIKGYEDIDDPKKKELFVKFIERLGGKSQLPIFDYYGNLLWPHQNKAN